MALSHETFFISFISSHFLIFGVLFFLLNWVDRFTLLYGAQFCYVELMNVTHFFAERKAEVEAFSAVLFTASKTTQPQKSRPGKDRSRNVLGLDNTCGTSGCSVGDLPLTRAYRRPASSNIPVSHYLHEVKMACKRERARSGGARDTFEALFDAPTRFSHVLADSLNKLRARKRARGGSGEISPNEEKQMIKEKLRRLSIKRKYRRLLSYSQWKLFLKRKFRLRKQHKPSWRRRRVLRRLALQYGKRQALCACSEASHPETAAPNDFQKGRRRYCQPCIWLPSHHRYMKRFHFHKHRVQLRHDLVHESFDGEKGASAPAHAVDIAVPAQSQRKGHRRLQRWVRHLRIPSNGCTQQSQFSQLSPPLSFLADRSHYCVYAISTAESVFRAESNTAHGEAVNCHFNSCVAALQRLARLFNLSVVSEHVGWVLPALRRPRTGRRPRPTAVLHGHMWSACPEGALGASMARARVAPVSLIHLTAGAVGVVRASASSSARRDVIALLVAPTAVQFSSRVLARCGVRLVSHWTPCTAPTGNALPLASLFELWCAGGLQNCVVARDRGAAPIVRCMRESEAAKDTPETTPLPCVPEAIRSTFGRLLKRTFVLPSQRRPGGKKAASGQTPTERCTLSARKRRNTFSLVLFPTLMTNSMSKACSSRVLESCVWSAVFLSHPTQSPTPLGMTFSTPPLPRSSVSTTRAQKRQHFRAARLLFGFLLQAGKRGGPRGCSGSSGCGLVGERAGVGPSGARRFMPIGYRQGCVMIGEQERNTILHLLGRAVFPDDYCETNSHLSSRKKVVDSPPRLRIPPSCGQARKAAELSREDSFGASVGHSRRAWLQHPIQWYGNLTNASYRVLVRGRLMGHSLPRAHGVSGSWLMEVDWVSPAQNPKHCRENRFRLQQNSFTTACGDRSSSDLLRVQRLGVTTCDSFFSQRFGSSVILVWLLFPLQSLNKVNSPSDRDADERRLDLSFQNSYASWSSLVSGERPKNPKIWFLTTPWYGAQLLEISDQLLHIMGSNQGAQGDEHRFTRYSSQAVGPHNLNEEEITPFLKLNYDATKRSLRQSVFIRQRIMEEMLCDGEKITIVDVLPLFV